MDLVFVSYGVNDRSEVPRTRESVEADLKALHEAFEHRFPNADVISFYREWPPTPSDGSTTA